MVLMWAPIGCSGHTNFTTSKVHNNYRREFMQNAVHTDANVSSFKFMRPYRCTL